MARYAVGDTGYPESSSAAHRAFSLVELSIVLVILGLLVGGVLGGQSLIKAAQLRSVTTDLNKFQTAINAFQVKYNALPGDMSNAIDYWGAAHATPATCITTASTSQATCNGNGDGIIARVNDSIAEYEMFRAWQHLSNAGLVEGSFTGIAGPGGAVNSIAGTNSPRSRLNGGYLIYYLGSNAYTGSFYTDTYKTVIGFGANDATYEGLRPVLSPEDAFAIDSKLDDGKPGKGNVMTLKASSGFNPGCATSDTNATAEYALTNTSTLCSLLFKQGF